MAQTSRVACFAANDPRRDPDDPEPERYETFRTRLIAHILHMKSLDPDYARYALANYHRDMPWLCLPAAIREALKGQQ